MTDVSTEEFTSNPVRRYLGRKVRRRVSLAVTIGLAILVLYVFVAVFAPVLAPQNPLKQDSWRRPPRRLGGGHLLGTDELGRDVLSRLIYATRTDLPIRCLPPCCQRSWEPSSGLLPGIAAGGSTGLSCGLLTCSRHSQLRTGDRVGVRALVQGTASILIAFTLLGWLVYAAHPVGGVAGSRIWVRVGSSTSWGADLANRSVSRSSKRHSPNACLPTVRHCVRDAGAGLVLVSRPQGSAADTRMGRHDRRGPTPSSRSMVAVHRARNRHHGLRRRVVSGW